MTIQKIVITNGDNHNKMKQRAAITKLVHQKVRQVLQSVTVITFKMRRNNFS